MPRQPAIYLPHGGGPWPWMAATDFPPGSYEALRAWLVELPGRLPEPPRAVLLITAHWEAGAPTVGSAAQPGMLYDYGGFPEHTYRVRWPAPGDPALAARVLDRLREAGLPGAEDPRRGYDHGTFVPMAVAWPEARVPTVQMSLVRGLDPATHLAIGRALAPLRDEGVLILGSGMSFHNLPAFFRGGAASLAGPFHAWLKQTIRRPREERDRLLTDWALAPGARLAHPREEHLLPLMVVAGAADEAPGEIDFDAPVLGAPVLAAWFS